MKRSARHRALVPGRAQARAGARPPRSRALWTTALAVLGAVTVVTALSAAPDARPPRIVSSVMQDTDGDARADRLRLLYSERVRHPRDRDGRYPFTVAGYRIRSVGAASRKAILLRLVEKPKVDGASRPTVRYRPTGAQAVEDGAGNEAVAQVFRATRAHGKRAPGNPPPPPPPAPPTAVDRDGDGAQNDRDCAPDDPAVRPGAADPPDLAFVDANCDGIDGVEADAVFASPQGRDTNPGTKTAPKREIQAAVAAAAGKGKIVLAAAGIYGRVTAVTGVGVYGGYDPATWSRRADLATAIVGMPEGLYADRATGVVLQLLHVRGAAQLKVGSGASFYGIRAVNGSSLTLQRVTALARAGEAGADGTAGAAGLPGRPGTDGGKGQCDGSTRGRGGAGGASPAGFPGGDGGRGGHDTGGKTGTGADGGPGEGGALGGKGRPAGDPGRDGLPGDPGGGGAAGADGVGGSEGVAAATLAWVGSAGSDGRAGTPGRGGGGGGGGGGQVCTFCNNGSGNGGGGGGGGGGAGAGGKGGEAGGGSFGVYLYDSSASITAGSSVTAGDGGAGGRGGDGGAHGVGGSGGLGATYCKSEIGEGGNGGQGGFGGPGGGGGGGAGGPSIALFKVVSEATVSSDSTLKHGSGGPGGTGGKGVDGKRPNGATGHAKPVYG